MSGMVLRRGWSKWLLMAADAVEQSIIDGTFHPFQGPIKNQKGELVVKAGEVLSDKELLGLNWYVEGVEGSIPK